MVHKDLVVQFLNDKLSLPTFSQGLLILHVKVPVDVEKTMSFHVLFSNCACIK